MSNIVRSIYLDSEFGVPTELDSAGTPLENRFVYDSAARELKAMAAEGLVRIEQEEVRNGCAEPLIARISFSRLR